MYILIFLHKNIRDRCNTPPSCSRRRRSALNSIAQPLTLFGVWWLKTHAADKTSRIFGTACCRQHPFHSTRYTC